MFDLSAHVLRITLEATEPIALEQHPGSSLRGALFEMLLRRFCMNREASTCAECPLNVTCPVAGLVAPLRDERPRGRDVPRPFVPAADELPAASAATVLANGSEKEALSASQIVQPGETFTFTLTLFGRAISYFPYLALGISALEQQGLGRPLRTNHGRRGRPRIVRIVAVSPFTEECEALFMAGEASVRKPTLTITPDAIAARAALLSSERLTLCFRTPTRLVAQGKIVARPEPRVLVARLVERLEALEREYADAPPLATIDDEQAHAARRERYLAAERLARTIRLAADETRWIDLMSHSARQRRSLPIGGFVGSATFEGELGPLRELLAWGEITHVGKNAVKGDGFYRIEPITSAASDLVPSLAQTGEANTLLQTTVKRA